MDWELAYCRGETPWDKGEASPPLRWFLESGAGAAVPVGRVLVPGCGAGHDVRLLAGLADVEVEVAGLDIASKAVEMARSFPAVGREHYRVGDFLAETASAPFDWVVEHTCLCALPPERWVGYAAAVDRHLKPGGYFLGVFFVEVPNFDGEGPPWPIAVEAIPGLFRGFEVVFQAVPPVSYPDRPRGCERVVLFRKTGNADATGFTG